MKLDLVKERFQLKSVNDEYCKYLFQVFRVIAENQWIARVCFDHILIIHICTITSIIITITTTASTDLSTTIASTGAILHKTYSTPLIVIQTRTRKQQTSVFALFRFDVLFHRHRRKQAVYTTQRIPTFWVRKPDQVTLRWGSGELLGRIIRWTRRMHWNCRWSHVSMNEIWFRWW